MKYNKNHPLSKDIKYSCSSRIRPRSVFGIVLFGVFIGIYYEVV